MELREGEETCAYLEVEVDEVLIRLDIGRMRMRMRKEWVVIVRLTTKHTVATGVENRTIISPSIS